MPVDEAYRKQVSLLIKTVPLVAPETAFALKGGTAINLFLRDMPRLSVDIDLTYVPVADREPSLREIDAALHRIKKHIERGIPGARVSASAPKGGKYITKLVVRADVAQIKIEVTPVLRGCVYEPAVRSVSARVEDEFGFAEMPVVSFADLYAGKIVAALDRQHPRDLFDVRDLLAHEGINDNLRKAFIVYLLSHDRPMAEVLAPTRRDISAEYKRGFEGMVDVPVTLDELLQAREELIGEIVGKMPEQHQRFLSSVKRGEPDWALLDLPGVKDLPAVRWKLENLTKLSPEKRARLLAGLNAALGMKETS
jgi:predicted nucleotidyltransferase component of viral defense system